MEWRRGELIYETTLVCDVHNNDVGLDVIRIGSR